MTAVDLHYQKRGSGPALVVLHGLFGESGNWRDVAERLARHFTVITPDLRNHGDSPHADEFHDTVWVEDLDRLLAREKLPSALLLGHSLGGKVAMQFALIYPERIPRLIIVDIAPKTYPPMHLHVFQAMMGVDPSQFKSRTEVGEAMAPLIPGPTTRMFLLKNLATDKEGRLRWKINLKSLLDNYPRLNDPLKGPPFTKPTLVIRGEKSPYVQEADYPLFQKHFPTAQFITIAGAGHWPHTEKPEEFTQLVINFLTKE